MSTNCRMCRTPIPEDQGEIRACPNCGADLARSKPKPPPLDVPSSTPERPPHTEFAKNAAVFSICAPFMLFTIAFFVTPMFRDSRAALAGIGLFQFAMIIGGIVLGIIAMVATIRQRRIGLFVTALVGTVLNSLLILTVVAMVVVVFKAVQRVEARSKQQDVQQTRPNTASAAYDAEDKAATQLARATIKTFIDGLNSKDPQKVEFTIRRDFPTASEVDEQIWLQDVSFDGEVFHGTIMDEPVATKAVKLGERVAVKPEEVADWWYVDRRSKKMIGGYTMRVWAKRQTPERRKEWEKNMGIDTE